MLLRHSVALLHERERRRTELGRGEPARLSNAICHLRETHLAERREVNREEGGKKKKTLSNDEKKQSPSCRVKNTSNCELRDSQIENRKLRIIRCIEKKICIMLMLSYRYIWTMFMIEKIYFNGFTRARELIAVKNT